MSTLTTAGPRRSGIVAWAAFAIVCAALRLGSELLIPIALAFFASFLLHPLVERLERAGLSRVLAVVIAVLGAGLLVTGLAWIAAREAIELVGNLPNFRANLAEKLRALRGPLRTLVDALGWVERLSRELEPSAAAHAPTEVAVVEAPSALSTVLRLASPLLGVLGVTGVVAVLAFFLVLEKDLKARIGAVLAERDSRVSLDTLQEASTQVGRYLARQCMVCAIHGVVVGAGLWLIGVPGAALFGGLSAALRLVPYLGPWIAATLPIALCLVAFRDWNMALYTSGFFVVIELLSNNVLEPRAFSSGTGLSPLGVIFATVFWAWLWGGAGLFLAIPLTVCLVVLGRALPELAFLPALIGDAPSSSAERRLIEFLSRDDVEGATGLLRRCSEGHVDLVPLSDSLVLPALARLRAEVPDDLEALLARFACAIDGMRVQLPATSERGLDGVAGAITEARSDPIDRFAREWLALVLARLGFRVREPGASGVEVSVSVGNGCIAAADAALSLCFTPELLERDDVRVARDVRSLVEKLALARRYADAESFGAATVAEVRLSEVPS